MIIAPFMGHLHLVGALLNDNYLFSGRSETFSTAKQKNNMTLLKFNISGNNRLNQCPNIGMSRMIRIVPQPQNSWFTKLGHMIRIYGTEGCTHVHPSTLKYR